MSFMVMSSSLVPPPVSISTEGLIVTGGTAKFVMMRFSGRPGRSSSSQASSLMAEKRASTRMGLRSSPAYAHRMMLTDQIRQLCMSSCVSTQLSYLIEQLPTIEIDGMMMRMPRPSPSYALSLSGATSEFMDFST